MWHFLITSEKFLITKTGVFIFYTLDSTPGETWLVDLYHTAKVNYLEQIQHLVRRLLQNFRREKVRTIRRTVMGKGDGFAYLNQKLFLSF